MARRNNSADVKIDEKSKAYDNKRRQKWCQEKKKKDAAKMAEKGNNLLDSTKRDNDPNWYFTDASIASLAASISFNEFLGVRPTIGFSALGSSSTDWKYTKNKINIPSIMSIGASPAPGVVDTTQHGINLAALKMYSELSSMNAKGTAYAPQDLTMLMLSLGEVISVTEHIRRAFGVAFTYNMRNRDLPSNLLRAMGFDPDDFLKNIANHRLVFNTIITAINKIPFLNNIAYFYKCADMYQKVYTDEPSAMAQLIVVCPHTTWKLKEDYNDKGSGLVTVPLPTAMNPGTFNTWANTLREMVDQLLQSSTFNYIYADVLNYSTKRGAKMLFLDYLLEGYSVVPEYNANFLLQVHNSTLLGEVYIPTDEKNSADAKGNDVSCNANSNMIIYRAKFKAVNGCALRKVLFDFPTDTPSVEDIIEASRFTSLSRIVFDDTDAAKTKYFDYDGADHYFNTMYISDDSARGTFFPILSSIIAGKLDIWSTTYLTKFTNAPFFYVLPENFAIGDQDVAVLGDTTYFTTVSIGYLQGVNDIAMLSLFSLR